MGQPTTEFFEGLSERGYEPMLKRVTGTLRLDLLKNRKPAERWLISIDKGNVEVSHRDAQADCRIQAPESLFDGMAAGEVNALAAMLRGELAVEGDSRLLVRFQGLLPGPPPGASPASRKAGRGKR